MSDNTCSWSKSNGVGRCNNLGSNSTTATRTQKHECCLHWASAKVWYIIWIDDVPFYSQLEETSFELIECCKLFHFSSSYPSKNIGCVSKYLRKARPELIDIRYVFVKDTYDSFLENHEQDSCKHNEFISPDLIAILNCGFIFYDSWNASIPHLFKFPNVPVIFTEYHQKDAESNLQKIKALGKIIILLNYII